MDSVLINTDVISNVASFLPVADVTNLIFSSRHLSLGGSDSEPNVLPSQLLNESIRTSLISVMGQRSEFTNAPSFISGIRSISMQLGRGKVAIAGSLIVEAMLKGNGSNEEFTAGDVDIYATTDSLHLVRAMLAEHGFAFMGTLRSRYDSLNSSGISHVESYSITADSNIQDVSTFENAMKTMRIDSCAREILSGRFPQYSAFAMPPNFPCFVKRGVAKHIDLVVTTSETVSMTIENFDIACCTAQYDGVSLTAPDLVGILRYETRLASQHWAHLLNAYASLFIATYSLKKFHLLTRSTNPAYFAPKLNAFYCLRQLRERRDVQFPDWSGDFSNPLFQGRRLRLDSDYVVTLHNMLVKISWRVIKYSKARKFSFTNITVDEFLKPKTAEESSRPGENSEQRRRPRKQNTVGPATTSTTTSTTAPVKRAKLRHMKHMLSSPVFRVKFRHQDKSGIQTLSFCGLE